MQCCTGLSVWVLGLLYQMLRENGSARHLWVQAYWIDFVQQSFAASCLCIPTPLKHARELQINISWEVDPTIDPMTLGFIHRWLKGWSVETECPMRRFLLLAMGALLFMLDDGDVSVVGFHIFLTSLSRIRVWPQCRRNGSRCQVIRRRPQLMLNPTWRWFRMSRGICVRRLSTQKMPT